MGGYRCLINKSKKLDMKKKYIIPVAKVIAVEYLLMSGSAVKGPEGVGYGGKDDTGSKDPASRGYRNGDDWDDEDE